MRNTVHSYDLRLANYICLFNFVTGQVSILFNGTVMHTRTGKGVCCNDSSSNGFCLNMIHLALFTMSHWLGLGNIFIVLEF